MKRSKDMKLKYYVLPLIVTKKQKLFVPVPYTLDETKRGKVCCLMLLILLKILRLFLVKINYFEMQSKVLEQILENEKIRTLFMEERIDDPIFEALTLNHKSIQGSIIDFYKKGLAILEAEGVQENMSEYVSAKAIAKISGTTTLTISLAVFGAFVTLMLLIVFYKIERHLQSYTNSNKD